MQFEEMVKALFILSHNINSKYGGGQIYVSSLIDEFIRQGLFPVIASPRRSESEAESYNGCRIVQFKQPLNLDGATLILQEIKPELVHAHGFKAVFAEACKKLRIPCIITAHHGGIVCPAGTLLNHRDEICRIKSNHNDCLPCVLRNIRGGFYAWPLILMLPLKARLALGRFMQKMPFILYLTPILKAALAIQDKADEWKAIHENATLLIAPSDAIAESMIRNGSPRNKIKAIPHGIPFPNKRLLSDSLQHRGKINQSLRFFYVGRICYVKGVHVLLSAFNNLDTDAELHIFGGVGNKQEERYMVRLKNKYRKNTRIIWNRKIDSEKVYEVINQYDVMIHPAIYLEVFGLNIAEALVLGKPVIATRCGGPEMQIEDGVNGILVEPNNSLVLANTMRKVINNIINLKVNNTDVIPIERHVKELIELYEEIAN